MGEIRQIIMEDPVQRVETGAVVFGEDWPGTFIRGDDSANFAFHLEALLQGRDNPISRRVCESLVAVLQDSNLVRRRSTDNQGDKHG